MARSGDMEKLIFDLGMHDGSDTEYYLRKGYRVVAIDANPELCRQGRVKFAEYLANERLVILNLAISDVPGPQTFYIPRHFENLASLYLDWASRETDSIDEVEVDSASLADITARFGLPFYLKIDIEGADYLALKQLSQLSSLPPYVSVEDCRFGFDYLEILDQLGYRGFKIQDQSMVPQLQDADLGACFHAGSSGPLGEDIPGAWLSYPEVLQQYSTEVRRRDGERIASRDRWFDLHARFS